MDRGLWPETFRRWASRTCGLESDVQGSDLERGTKPGLQTFNSVPKQSAWAVSAGTRVIVH